MVERVQQACRQEEDEGTLAANPGSGWPSCGQGSKALASILVFSNQCGIFVIKSVSVSFKSLVEDLFAQNGAPPHLHYLRPQPFPWPALQI